MLRDDLVLFRSLPYGPSGGLAEVLADQLKRGKRYMVFHGVCTYKSQIGDACSFVDTQDDELASVTLSSDHLAPFRNTDLCHLSSLRFVGFNPATLPFAAAERVSSGWPVCRLPPSKTTQIRKHLDQNQSEKQLAAGGERCANRRSSHISDVSRMSNFSAVGTVSGVTLERDEAP